MGSKYGAREPRRSGSPGPPAPQVDPGRGVEPGVGDADAGTVELPLDARTVPQDGGGEDGGGYPDMGRCSGPDRPGNMWWDDEDLKVNVGQPIHHGMYLTKDGIGYDDTNTEDRNRNMTQEGSFLHTLKIVVPIVILYYL